MTKPRTLPALALALLASAAAQAQITIDHAKALAGNVTPGDAPGYPVTLSKPGSYVLTGNLELGPQAAPIAVNITANNVTLDLNGFSIMRLGAGAQCQQYPNGAVGCDIVNVVSGSAAPDHSGVKIEGVNAVVRNGVVQGFVGHGIYSGHPGAWIDGVRVAHNKHNGIHIQGLHGAGLSRVTHVSAMLNGGHGVLAQRGLIDGTTAYSNGGFGYWLSVSNLGQSTAWRNTLGGIFALAGTPTLVRGSQFIDNYGPEVSGPLRSGGDNVYDGVVF